MVSSEPTTSSESTLTISPRRQRDVMGLLFSTAVHVLMFGVAAIAWVGAVSLGEPNVDASVAEFDSDLPDEAIFREPVEIQPIDNKTSGLLGGADDANSMLAENDATWTPSASGLHVGSTEPKGSRAFGGSFFGVGGDSNGSAGERIVYIVDVSGSMRQPLIRHSRFQRVQKELEDAILSLHVEQKFLVVMFSDGVHAVGPESIVHATDRNKNRVLNAIAKKKPGGHTDPRGAISRALRMKPDTIFFLTDGEFHPNLAQKLMKGNKELVVHTFTLGDNVGEEVMKLIAQVNGGTYTFVNGNPDAIDAGKAKTMAVAPLSGNGTP